MNLFEKWKQGLQKSSKNLLEKVQGILMPGHITEEFLDNLEEALIQSDVGMEAAGLLRERIVEENKRQGLKSQDDLLGVMAGLVKDIFEGVSEPLRVAESGPTVYVLIGVNGSGKTTTIAKLAKRWKDRGKSVIMAAADTFRAAAGDQLAVWAQRTGSMIIQHQEGSDPGAVAFDAVKSAIARKIDLVLVDTAGRLHTQKNLVEELKKIVRVIGRELPGAPHEVLLVVDGTTGQNGLNQARTFAGAAGVTGICITKLDGSSKGGIAVAIAEELKIPVKLVGVGEAMDDLRDFDPEAFSKALFGRES
ncbi:MAG: signal recognition particle-docking protein FtsY [Bacillota bacterium]